MRPVLIVGMDDQTAKVCEVIADHPELGFEAVGLISQRDEAERAGLGDLWRGDLDELIKRATITDESVTGAIVSSTSSLAPSALNEVTHVLFEQKCHVHLSTGITGIDQRRIRPMHLAYEPLLYLEPLELTRGQLLAQPRAGFGPVRVRGRARRTARGREKRSRRSSSRIAARCCSVSEGSGVTGSCSRSS